MENLTDKQIEQIKNEFHKELQGLYYDLGGSLADLVEDALANALRRMSD